MDDDGGGMEMWRRKWGGQARNLKEREREPLSLHRIVFFFFLSVVFGAGLTAPRPPHQMTRGSRPSPQEECLWEDAALLFMVH